MNPRERFAAICNHQEADRVPVDWGRHVGSIHRNGYRALKQYLNDPELRNDDAVLDRMVQNVYPDETLLRRFGVDFRWIEPHWVGVKEADGQDAYIDMWGITWVHMLNSYSLADSPLKHATIDDVARHDWPDPYNPQIWAGLGQRARWLYENTDYVVVADSI
jgi:uroporphyrinogen decarboxylase